MRYYEFTTLLEKAATPNVAPDIAPQPITKQQVESVLRANGYEDFKINGNKINVLVQIPAGQKKNEFRTAILNEILAALQQQLPQGDAEYSADPGISSLGGIVFTNSPVIVVVKDTGKQGDQSAGVANEIELAGLLESVVQ